MVYTTIGRISISQTLPRFQIWVPTFMVPELNCTTNGVMHDKWVGRDHANAKWAVHKQTHKSCSVGPVRMDFYLFSIAWGAK